MISRHLLLGTGAAIGAVGFAQSTFSAPARDGLSSDLVARAQSALAPHRDPLAHVDRIGMVDFALPSRQLDLADGSVTSHLVAHGRGSDPAHSGWVTRLSNEPGSFTSSAGAYVTGNLYMGAHGRSLRLAGLDAGNSNAESRAVVVHAAWYVSHVIALNAGKLGRSERCFAVAGDSLDAVLSQLGPGRRCSAKLTNERRLP